jgi:hypothetical protein
MHDPVPGRRRHGGRASRSSISDWKNAFCSTPIARAVGAFIERRKDSILSGLEERWLPRRANPPREPPEPPGAEGTERNRIASAIDRQSFRQFAGARVVRGNAPN